MQITGLNSEKKETNSVSQNFSQVNVSSCVYRTVKIECLGVLIGLLNIIRY